jgi:yeast amino acid transporter
MNGVGYDLVGEHRKSVFFHGDVRLGTCWLRCKENPRNTIPSVIRKVFYRIAFLFVFTVFFIGIIVPSNDHRLTASAEGGASGTNANASPLVLAAKRAGVKVLPSLINSVLLTVVLLAASSNVYTASRTLIGLAQEGFAPRIFTKTTKSGVRYWSMLFTSLFGLLGFLNVSNTGSTVFEWLMQMAGLAGFITWASLNACHLAFMNTMKAREISRDTLPYKAFWQPYFSYYGIFFNVLIMFTQGFTAFIPHLKVVDFFINYLSPILFVLLWTGHKFIFRPTFVRPGEADIDTGRVDDQDR